MFTVLKTGGTKNFNTCGNANELELLTPGKGKSIKPI
jgi:hypothetical protein